MKHWKKWLVFIIIGLGIVALNMLYNNRSRHFNWEENFESKSEHPYGLKLYDDLMKASLPNGYKVSASLDTNKLDYNLLVIDNYSHFYKRASSNIYKILAAGNTVVIISEPPYSTYENNDTDTFIEEGDEDSGVEKSHPIDSIKVLIDALNECHLSMYSEEDIVDYPQMLKNSPILELRKPLTRSKNVKTVTARKGFCKNVFSEDLLDINGTDLHGKRLWTSYNKFSTIIKNEITERKEKKELALAVHAKVSKGNLYFISTPRCFSNAGILDEKTLPFVVNTMDIIADKPVIRIKDTFSLNTDISIIMGEEESETVFTFFHEHKALNLMLYIVLVGFLLAIFFNTRRRQRAIDVRKPERNITLSFIRQIASLHNKNSDYQQLYVNKLYAFAEILRKKTGADIFNCTDKDYLSIARRTGIKEDDIKEKIVMLINLYKNHEDGMTKMTFKEFVQATDIIKEIKDKI